MKLGLKIPSRTVKYETIFEKNHPTSVILKILKKIQLDDIIKPTRLLYEFITIAKCLNIHLKYTILIRESNGPLAVRLCSSFQGKIITQSHQYRTLFNISYHCIILHNIIQTSQASVRFTLRESDFHFFCGHENQRGPIYKAPRHGRNDYVAVWLK